MAEENKPISEKKNPGKTLAILGIVSGGIAFAFLPPLFGIAGIILGSFAVKKGNKQLGWAAVGISIAGFVVGIILGWLFYVISRS